MTFEATRKKQVLVLQPRGKALYEDDSSFGSKMLAKMGWSKGNGLGKEQHGNLDFIQIRYKNNANGLGYDGLKDNQWTENESQFDSLLKSLNGTPETGNTPESGSGDEQATTVVKSLEEKSKLSRARVHYKKFTRGKDVHKYSEKELANILGKKTLTETELKPEVVEEVEEDKPCVYDSNLIVNAGLSVTDYFKQKMQAKLQQSTGEQSDSSGKLRKKQKKRKDIEEATEEETAEPAQEEETVEPTVSKKKRKRTLSVEIVEQALDEPEEPSKKKKKSKKARELEPTEEPPVLQEELPKKSKKKSKRQEVEIVEEVSVEEKPKKSKKKSRNDSDEATAVAEPLQSSSKAPLKHSGEPDRPTGANAVYSTNVIQIPSHVAQKMSHVTVDSFKNSNIANIIGYGLTEDIEMKIIQTKVGDNSFNTDKYSLYNMDNLTTRQKVNPRKIMSKIKRTKKSIQVI